jgi:hypothetical protein
MFVGKAWSLPIKWSIWTVLHLDRLANISLGLEGLNDEQNVTDALDE